MNMKSKLLNAARLLSVFILVTTWTFVFVSCDKTETTDPTGFILHYYGVTDIGPSMSYELQEPTYKGNVPYDFSITGVTLKDEAYTGTDNFVIDAQTGKITIQNTESMATGLYSISVSCYSNNKSYNFKNAVQVNMLFAVPEGITVEPAEVLVKQEEENWWEASAKVITDAEKHVSIIKYDFAEDESRGYQKYFTIKSGVITFNPGQKDNIAAGEKYVLSLKLTTKAGSHIYPDAVTFKVISKPYNLLYKPDKVKIEANTAHESQLPAIQGSEGIIYAIKSITPKVAGITIDEKTGKISIAENSLSPVGATYKIDVTANNEYGSADFLEAYAVTAIDFINPIAPATFNYTVPETYEEMEYAIPVAEGLVGDEVVYNFSENNPEAIKEQIEKGRMHIDIETGAISIAKNNTLASGDYTVFVKASNVKGEVTTSFVLPIKANPNKFTFYYGNNLGLSPAGNYINQYEVDDLNGLKALDLLPVTTLNGRSAKWKLVVKRVMGAKDQLNGTTIDAATGKINFSAATLQEGSGVAVGMLVIDATVGEGPLACTVTAPVFVRYNAVKDNSTVKYKPFAIQINPRRGGRSAKPETVTPENLIIDFRANFTYFDINTTANSGVKPDTKEGDESNNIMKYLWRKFYETTKADGGVPNFGAKKPMSALDTGGGFNNPKNLNLTLGYIDQADRSVVINTDMWKSASNEYLNGVLIPQVVYSTDGSDNKNKRFIPVAIWFNENFE